MDFDSKTPNDTVTLSFDFAALTPTIDTATVTITRASGFADATPGTILSGGPQIAGTKVLQLVTGGIDGTRYELVALAVKAGQTFRLTGYLPVLDSHYTTR